MANRKLREIRKMMTSKCHFYAHQATINPFECGGNYIILVHWPLMGGLLHLVQRGRDWAEPQPAQAQAS